MDKQQKQQLMQRREKADAWVKKTEDAICAKMERVRLGNGISAADFSDILGYSYKLGYGTMVMRRHAKVTLEAFLQFCYMFGYDIGTAVDSTPENTEIDRATFELAAILTSFTPDGLEDLARAISTTQSIPVSSRKRGIIALRNFADMLRRHEKE